jgi:hypothetical protein
MAVYTTLAECKRHLRVDFNDDDEYIGDLQDLVEELVLTAIRGSYVGEGTVTTNGTTSLVGTDTDFLSYSVGDAITVYGETIRTIATITDNEHLTVTSAFSTSSTGLTYKMHEGLPLIGGTTLPRGLKHAMLILIGHFYQNREPVSIGVSVNEIPMTYQYLINPWKHWTIA